MKKFYKSVSFVSRELKKELFAVKTAQEIVDNSTKRITEMGEKLYKQFRFFVTTNHDLFDNEFVLKLAEGDYTIEDVSVVEIKKAYRLIIKISSVTSFVMIPFLFISDEEAYKLARKRKIRFGKGATIETVEKHYDEKMDKLMAEVEALKQERAGMVSEDWN